MNVVLVDKPNIELYGQIKYPQIFRWTRIILFEFLASFIYTYGVMSSYYLPGTSVRNPAHSIVNSLSLFLALCLSGQLTGGHTNPIITLAMFICRKVTTINLIVYVVSQFAGSLGAAATAYLIIYKYSVPQLSRGSSLAQQFGNEFFGSFLLILWLIIITNENTTFIKANFWNYILLPVMFFIIRQITSQIDGLNPASILANQIFFWVKYGDTGPLEVYWTYLVGSLAGSIIASLFFNYIYLPIFNKWKVKK